MAVKIRLKRMGKIRTAIYRVVVMDSRTKRDGRAIEEIGKYDPNQEPSLIEIDMDRANYWRGQGAQPTEAVAALLKIMDEGTLKVAETKANKKDLYEAALAAAGKADGADASGATTAKKKAAKKSDAAEAPKAEEKVEEAPKAADTDSGAASADSVDADADASATEAAPVADLPAGAVAALEDGSAPEGYTVKGNKDSGKYHEPDGQWYDQTVAEVWFKSGADAEAAGFVKAGS
ncbi:30S ribosomal protein S16 [Knoellia sinensis KCTC 19936]|uniref:Small ribosomal subunit protein bS16 n=1 Tax=Knoellia sinensis KCTC 19936 TaxID=1385520 RepID=A0A0A0J553_9MICO|nr:30S ribosomal protein S16 [Knoellia sinensis KCTC 19936]